MRKQVYAANEIKHEILDTREAAEYLSISTIFLSKMRVSGGGPKFYKLGRAVRYSLRDLENWIKENRYSHTAQYEKGGVRDVG